RRSVIEDRGSRIEDRGSRIEDRGSRIEDRESDDFIGSYFLSSILDLLSSILDSLSANLGHRGDVTAAPRGGQRVAGHPDVGNLHWESVLPDGGLEFLQEAARLGRAAREDDRHRALDPRQLARGFELFAQCVDYGIDHFLVIDIQGAGYPVLR